MKYGVPVHVRSSFSDRTGTMVVGEEGFESVAVAGVAYDKGEAKVQLVRMKDKPGVVAKILWHAGRAQRFGRHDHPEPFTRRQRHDGRHFHRRQDRTCRAPRS